jgi:hypothetical protein
MRVFAIGIEYALDGRSSAPFMSREPLKRNLMGIGGLRTYIRNCVGVPPGISKLGLSLCPEPILLGKEKSADWSRSLWRVSELPMSKEST